MKIHALSLSLSLLPLLSDLVSSPAHKRGKEENKICQDLKWECCWRGRLGLRLPPITGERERFYFSRESSLALGRPAVPIYSPGWSQGAMKNAKDDLSEEKHDKNFDIFLRQKTRDSRAIGQKKKTSSFVSANRLYFLWEIFHLFCPNFILFRLLFEEILKKTANKTFIFSYSRKMN